MNISDEYFRGLIEGEGSFTFSTRKKWDRVKASWTRQKVPAFMLQLHERNEVLVTALRDRLGLRNKIYRYANKPLVTKGKIYQRGNRVVLTVRDFGSLKNKVIPFFYGHFHGHKGEQFHEWLEKIGSDPFVPRGYELLFRLHKCGFFERLNRNGIQQRGRLPVSNRKVL